MKSNYKPTRGFTLVELLVVIVIIAALAGLTAPMVIRQRKKADQTEAVSNARQIHMALFEFDNEYSSFPDATTLTAVKEATDSPLTSVTGTTSNDYFRQILAAGIGNEKMFYAKTADSKKPDDIFNTAAKALDAGECGFGYMMDGNSAFSSSSNSGRPLAVTPLAKGSAEFFDPEPFDKKAVILRIDGSASSLTINAGKRVAMGGGKTLLQNGEDTVWGADVKPKIAAPKTKGGANSGVQTPGGATLEDAG
jgi:prepilin-type N-terminal cleavage/methylation domain-containing protein